MDHGVNITREKIYKTVFPSLFCKKTDFEFPGSGPACQYGECKCLTDDDCSKDAGKEPYLCVNKDRNGLGTCYRESEQRYGKLYGGSKSK